MSNSNEKFLLAVDIGNTNIVCGFFKGKRLFMKLRLPTDSADFNIYCRIKNRLKAAGIKPESIGLAVISSVVPSASRRLIGLLKKYFNIKSLELGKDAAVPIKNLYKKPLQVGQDRLVNAYACLKLYGKPAIIVDFGTATTFDYINNKGAYCGGLITPGAEISLDGLYNKTALLPKIKLKKPKGLIGKDTAESMRSGILHGFSSMCDGIIEKVKEKFTANITVVATGGLSPLFAPYCKQLDYIDIDLTLKGIYLVSKKI